MKYINLENSVKFENSSKCTVNEYFFEDPDIDLCMTEITGRYPDSDYCLNEKCKELIYIIKGNGTIYFENDSINYTEGDGIIIDKNEKYYWDSKYTKAIMVCNPPFSKEQYKIVK